MQQPARFLVHDGLVDLTRYITSMQPLPFLDAVTKDAPLLRVIAQPATLLSISPVELTLERMETLSPSTVEQLRKRLLLERMELWGLRFDGHGGLVLQCQHVAQSTPWVVRDVAGGQSLYALNHRRKDRQIQGG